MSARIGRRSPAGRWRRLEERYTCTMMNGVFDKILHGKGIGTIVIALAVAVLFQADVRAQKIKKRKDLNRGGKAATSLSVFKGIERAWQGADAGALSKFAGESKVLLEVMGIGRRGGYYSRSQVYYMFRDMFEKNSQIKFEFVKYHNTDKPDRRVYGIAHRRYKNNRNGRLFQDKVYVTLRKEGVRWVVAEIKTTW